MAINLSKGGRINLSKTEPSLKIVEIQLGWNPKKTDTGFEFDLDSSVFAARYVGGNPQLVSEKHFVFYGNTTSPDGAIVHHGDNRTGAGDEGAPKEKITIDLSKVAPEVEEISFIVTIHEATDRKQNFGQVLKSYVSAVNVDTGNVIARYDLEDDFSTETAVQFGSLYRKDGEWLLKAIGTGYNKGLADFVRLYGMDVT